MASGSVMKGSGVLIVARLAGMLGGFALFLLLTWRSQEAAGVFRTATTFLVIIETLPLLGMHRWLATEIAHRSEQGWAIFRMAALFAVGVALVAGAAYFAIAFGGIYQAETAACLKLIALATAPSAIALCVASALVGIGCSHQSGVLTLAETATRSTLAILLVLAGADLIWVIVVFAVTRWVMAGAGLVLIRFHLRRTALPADRGLFRDFLAQVPNLALSMLGFLAIRNAALLLLPWFRDAATAGIYAAPYQLFDLLLLIPTVLTISTNYAFVASARHSLSAQRRNTNELASITVTYIFPLAALGCVLARPIIEFVFGTAYDGSVVPFRLLLLAAPVVSLDQVFSLAMVTAGKYRSDRVCIVAGALAAIAATCLLSGPWGAAGAATGILAGSAVTLALRLCLMRGVLRVRSFTGSVQLQALATLVAGTVVWLALAGAGFANPAALGLAPLGGAVYLAALYVNGGLSRRRLGRFQAFVARRG